MKNIVASNKDTNLLPLGWLRAALEDLVIEPKGDIVDGPFGSNLKASEYVDKGVPIVRLQNIERNLFVDKNIKYLTSDKAEDLRRHNFRPGDILITKLGDPLGKACEAPRFVGNGIIVADVVRLRLNHQFVDRAYLLQAINSEGADQLKRNTKGTTRPRVNLSAIRGLDVPVPPLPEQRRIVQKIEELFTKLDAGVRSLEQARAQLKSFRRSVLKAAVEGELSREWRDVHKEELEPASELLERILWERREKFAGKKYKEPVAPDTLGLPTLPDGWEWMSLAQATSRITDGTHQSPEFTDSGIPFIFVQHIVGGSISFEKTKFISEETYGVLNSRCPVENNDILYSAVGSYGVAVPVNTSRRFSFQRHIAHIKPLGSFYVRYLAACLNSPMGQDQAHKAARGVAQKTVALGELSKFCLPLPSLREQQFIIEEVERRLSVVDKLKATIEASLKQANGLRQSILKRAFSGELVPQDPDDEPASVLLERIREEREAAKPKGRKKGGGTEHNAAEGEWVPELFPRQGV